MSYTFSGPRDRRSTSVSRPASPGARNLDHHILRIEPDFLYDYRTARRPHGASSGRLFGATGAHEIYLNAQARELAPVRLTGNFGSEVLRSMSTFKPLRPRPELLEPDVARQVKTAVDRTAGDASIPSRSRPFARFHGGSVRHVGRRQVAGDIPDAVSRQRSRRPGVRAPAHSRRTPHSALSLIAKADERLARIPTDRGVIGNDRGLAHAARRIWAEVTFKLDYLHKEGLPDSLAMLETPLDGLAKIGVLGLHKYLPYRRWFRHEVAPHVREVLTDPRTSRLPYWNAAALGLIATDHIEGRRNYVKEINAVLTLEAIDRLLTRSHA